MTIGPLPSVTTSAAGAPLAQTKGAEAEKARQDAAGQQRHVQSAERAESAAGIGETDGQEHAPSERDADGRRLWEAPPRAQSDDTPDPPPDRHSKDATGQSGTTLDLCG
jgi:hypothetical protein